MSGAIIGRLSGQPTYTRANLAPKASQLRIGLRGRNELQTSTNRLGNTGATCSLRFVDKLRRNCNGDLAHPLHYICDPTVLQDATTMASE